jgi:hypothetical protein
MKIDDVVKKRAKNPEDLAKQIRKIVARGPVSMEELSTKLDRGFGPIEKAIAVLQAQNFHVALKGSAVEIVKDLPAGGQFRIKPNMSRGNRYKFGVVSDNHLGSKYARLDVLNALYDIFEERGIRDVYNAGNVVDGICRFNRFDLEDGCNSMEGQALYLAKHYPKRKGVKTYFIAGDDHEGWWVQNEGINIGQYLQDVLERNERSDMKYLAYMEADIKLPAPEGETWIRVMHPGGGSSYAYSYTSQKITESFQGGEKPHIVIGGHYHKADFCQPRGVYFLQAATTQDQTPFMRKKKLEAHVGGYVCEIEQAAKGYVVAMSAEFRMFFDKKFYTGEKYPRW